MLVRSNPAAGTAIDSGLERPEQAVFNVHVPPRRTTLGRDHRPGASLRPVASDGQIQMRGRSFDISLWPQLNRQTHQTRWG